MNDLLLAALPILAALMVVEAAWSRHRNKPVYECGDFWGSMSQLGGNAVIKLVTGGAMLAFNLFVYQFHIFDIGTGIFEAVLALILADFLFYWFHRCSHRVRIFWAVHVCHHSSEHMNLGTALRQPWLGPLMRIPFFWPLPLLGFDPVMTAIMGTVATLYGFWTHTKLIGRLGPLEWVFTCPAHHRAHHGSNPIYIDKNYANMLIIWDRLFGTYVDETEDVDYGLTTNINSFNPMKIAFHDWADLGRDMRGADGLKAKFGYLVKPPGWHPDKASLPPLAGE